MPRPRVIDEETILEAARSIFLSQGFAASTAAIAQRAGCSEGTLFKRFGSKERLFEAAMGIPDFRVDRRVEGLAGQGDVRANLEGLCQDLIAFLREVLPRTMRLWGHPGGLSPEKIPPHRGPHVALKALAGYLEAEMNLGRIRQADPEVLARLVLGSTHHYVFLEVLGIQSRMPMPPATFVRGLTELLWRGIAPEPTETTEQGIPD
jgi:AcrR family transcriptional regulator